MSEHNSRDCAALVSLTVEKQLAAKYRDVQCLLPVEEIQVLEVVGLKVLSIKTSLFSFYRRANIFTAQRKSIKGKLKMSISVGQ